jgi:CTP:molybdopterin cytidylyltransferase MocA
MSHVLVLAAGAGSRLGERPKALLTLPDGRTFVQKIVETARAAGATGISVVVGPPHGDAIRKALPAGAGAIVNPRPERGMLSSVQTGVQALPGNVTSVLIWPVDTPLVEVATIRAIFSAAPGQLVVPTYKSRGGHPIRVPRGAFPALSALSGEATLKDLVDGTARVHRLAVDDEGVTRDVDTPADLTAVGKPAKK